MSQLHKRFTTEQVKVLLRGYCQGMLGRAKVEQMLGMRKTRFFTLLKQYRQDPEALTISYRRTTGAKLATAVEAEIRRALLQEKEIVEDPRLPISGYNYSAVRDRLLKKGIRVSLNTIIRRAKDLSCQTSQEKKSLMTGK